MTPNAIFKRPLVRRPPGAYFLISILRLLETYIVSCFDHSCFSLLYINNFKPPNDYQDLKVYFDKNFARFIPTGGRWKLKIFKEDKNTRAWRPKNETKISSARRIMQKEKEPDSSNALPSLLSVSDSDSMPSLPRISDSDSDYEEDSPDEFIDEDGMTDRGEPAAGAKIGELGPYHVSKMAPLSTSSTWDEINARLNIKLMGPDSLQGLCDEASFARSNLPATMSTFLGKYTQARSAVFCLEQILSQDTKDVMRSAFATLLPDLLARAEATAPLISAIETLLTENPAICKRLPPETMKSIASYLERVNSAKRSSNTRTDTAKAAERPSSAV
ncbi:hypothetical protein CPC08DRAFT_318258 [Agrocybe pediades]|nr:hypothetical protein CPC08DRAFT_318258 [Agrocybe pediades]